MAGLSIDFTRAELYKAIRKVDTNIWEIPKNFRPYMRVPARLYMTKKLLDETEDGAIQQLMNMASLPGIVKYSIALPDAHWGYGFCIGGVAAFDVEEGIISPGGIGYDINCGVRFLITDPPLMLEDIKDKLRDLLQALKKYIPAGVGRGGRIRLSDADFDEVMRAGAKWAVENGFGYERDLEHIEDGGCLEGADPSKVSTRARQRGRNQLGTLGSGNHYIEVEVISEIYDEHAAEVMGIEEVGQIGLMIHTGSRGFGHQVASDYIDILRRAARKYNIRPRDIQLIYAPFNSPEGQSYFAAMKAAANYAFANRQMITHWARQAFREVFGEEVKLRLVYDVAHNIGKIEEHVVDGVRRKLIIHRKGATRGFAPGRPEIPQDYRSIGQPILIGGNMLQGSYILVGVEKAMRETFGSTVHGAGRRLSRKAATRRFWGREIQRFLAEKGILVDAASMKVLAEEAPEASRGLQPLQHELVVLLQ